MAHTEIGGDYKPQLKLDGKKVIVKSIGCYAYDKATDTDFKYREEVIYHFESEDKAMEYFYKKR
jgi:hypothetical protein